MKNAADNEKLVWSFHPPTGSHFSGLVEAGVKSFKTHFARVIGSQILTYEELYTVITQIEAILNSRPLCPLSSDPSDLSVLTPGHFLTLEPLTCLPDPDFSHLKLNSLGRWELLQRMKSCFWSRWHLEYLTNLQQKHKWNDPDHPLKVDDLVIIKQDNLSPLQWLMARVVELHLD
ncbi:hypothetical protein JTB14_001185 [Gonioctena quinquepunctata]|nr:hypothetical protein JTB14_001185 [Gonioctena quinquepunctata]